MKRHRVQAIIIKDKEVLFGSGCINREKKEYSHFFIGGGVEKGESTEDAIIRELAEEANITGKIIFQLSNELKEMHTTFLIDIGKQIPSLGYDPEEIDEADEYKALQKLIFIPLNNQSGFTNIDIEYFKILIKDCELRGYFAEWCDCLNELVSTYRIKAQG